MSVELETEDKSANTEVLMTDQVFKADQGRVYEAGQEDNMPATEIAKTCNDQKTGEYSGGAENMASVELISEDKSATTGVVKAVKVFEADQEDDKSETEIAKTCNGQVTGEPPGGFGVLASVKLGTEDKSAAALVVKKEQVFEVDERTNGRRRGFGVDRVKFKDKSAIAEVVKSDKFIETDKENDRAATEIAKT